MSISTPSLTWYVKYVSRPSARNLRDRLDIELDNTPTQASNKPYRLHVIYRIGSSVWRAKDNNASAWHLAAPSMVAVTNMCADLLTRKGILTPGQIVSSASSKIVGPVNENVLIVTIEPIDGECSVDQPSLELKLLQWFIEKSNLEGREPTKVTFRSLYKKLKNKNKG